MLGKVKRESETEYVRIKREVFYWGFFEIRK